MEKLMSEKVINVVAAGLGGQGVIKASDILAEAAFRAGYDVKKAEVHGMSQRGGSVSTDVRFGKKVLSPMVPPGEADYLLVLAADQVENNRHVLRQDGVLIEPAWIDESRLASKKSLNIALLGALSHYLPMSEEIWLSAVKANLPEKGIEGNIEAFRMGRMAASAK
jgi:indolepyruvate ferredoxin oxidoreductase, beta subunit